ncbi:MAG: thioredoxin [Eubacteriales bacterium]|nr:thioredoxin [Clostridiales bacterium]MDY5709512.1 thioredoxin [Eubacteriales bacterium]
MEVQLTTENFASVINTDKPVLIDFWATWCGPCRMIAPVIEEIARERADILVCKCNVDEEVPLAAQFGVNVIPTLVVLKNGRVAARTEGLTGKQNIIRLVENAI